ncbi:MAG: F-type H+-transporting ATPase subunit delta [Acidobacteriota bacterium]|nr:F-type H+-transporting ATPase subunit delta [Acidobacteriota bacterium]
MIRRFARPYARAIMDITGTPQKAAELRTELQRFADALRGASDLRLLYANPGIDLPVKLKITEEIAKKLGLSDLAVKVLDVLIRNHRINDIDGILDALAAYVNKELDIAVADVATAHKLSEPEIAQLRTTLEKQAGRRVEMHLTVDPTLLGGFVARIESRIYDASVVGKIEKFRQSLA